MTGRNVLPRVGFRLVRSARRAVRGADGTHPRTRTEANIVNFRRQLGGWDWGHDARRSSRRPMSTSIAGPSGSSCKSITRGSTPEQNKARPVSGLITEFDSGAELCRMADPGGVVRGGARGNRRRLSIGLSRRFLVNWYFGLGTVLANEEVTSEGRSERAIFRSSEASAAMDDAHHRVFGSLVGRSRCLGLAGQGQAMQRNWIGGITGGASVLFDADGTDIEVFTTRPDTLFGATYWSSRPNMPQSTC